MFNLDNEKHIIRKVAYYTLERGLNIVTGQVIKFLCSWNKEGTHLNHGKFNDEKMQFPESQILTPIFKIFCDLKDEQYIIVNPVGEIQDVNDDDLLNRSYKQTTCLSCGKKFKADCTNVTTQERIMHMCPNCRHLILEKWERQPEE